MKDDPAMRRRVADVVRRYPGLHVRELARQMETSVSLVEYHLAVLLERGVVKDDRDDGYQRIYPADAAALDVETRRMLALLRQRKPLQITLCLLDAGGGLRHGELVERMGIGKSTLSFHISKLAKGGLVERSASGIRLLAPRRVEDLLLRYVPTPDVQDDFASLWSSFYDA